MATLESVKKKIRSLIDAANAVTGNSETDLTRAMNTLSAGYGRGTSEDAFRYVTFMAADNETVESKVTVAPRFFLSSFNTPSLTKESTAEHDFTHVGWSLTPEGEASSILGDIREDLTLYPVFEASARKYTVRFWDGDKLLRTEIVPCHGSSSYAYKKVGAYFKRWEPAPEDVTQDLDCYGVWEAASFATDSWDQISQHARAGVAGSYYKVGDTRHIQLESGETVVMIISEINRAAGLSEGGTGNIAVLMITPPEFSNIVFDAEYDVVSTTVVGSDVWDLAHRIFFEELPRDLYNNVRMVDRLIVNTRFDAYSGNYEHLTSSYYWIPSLGEVAGAGSTLPMPLFAASSQEATNKAMASRIVKLFGTDEPVQWWLRDMADYGYAYMVRADGSIVRANIQTERAYVVCGFYL